MKKSMGLFLLSLLIFGLNLSLIYPYLLQSAPGWIESIEVSFITIGRWWGENFPHVFWNPYWYAGFPQRFSYVPLIPLSTAFLGRLIGNFGQAYHLIAGAAFALAPVSLFFFLRYLTKKNNWASLIGAFWFSLGPSLGNFFAGVRAAQNFKVGRVLVPWRMTTMIFYGEGPHALAQVFLPLAGLFYLKALEKGQRREIVWAAILIALVALANPIGLWGLGILLGSGLVVFLFWGKRTGEVVATTILTAFLAYLLVAFWYTFGFIKSDLFNEGGSLFSQFFVFFPWVQVAGLLFFGLLLGLLRRYLASPRTATIVFWLVTVSLIVTIFYAYEIELAPQARRYIPEMDMAGAALAAILLGKVGDFLKKRFASWARLVFFAGGVVLIFLLNLKTWGWASWFTRNTNVPETGSLEREMNQYLGERVRETERVFVSSNYTFWLNMETNLWQLRGGHWQASIHPWEIHAGYQITSDEDGETSLLWLKTFAIKWLVVSGHGSWLHYADYRYPDKFEGLVERVASVTKETEVVYKVPLTHGMAGPVSLAQMRGLIQPENGADKAALRAYVDWIETKKGPLSFKRINNDFYEIKGEIKKGEAIRVAMTYDKGFRAYDEEGRRLEIGKDILGFLLIDPQREGLVKISLVYGPTFDFYLGWVLTLAGIGVIIFWGKKGARG